MSSSERVAATAAAECDLDALIASWTAGRPGTECWIETGGTLRARKALEDALSAGARAVVVSGPSGHGKTTLIRSFWHRPPSGFAAVVVPPLDVCEPSQIAARILAATRHSAVHDAEGALERLLRAQTLRGLRPVLLVDDLHEMTPAVLASLLALAAASRVEVGVVAAGSRGRALDELRRALPRPVRKIEISDPWTRADAERLIARIGASLPIGAADLLAAIDVPEALRTSAGNPRLVRAALAAQLRQLNLPATLPAITPPQGAAPAEAAAPAEPANSEPAVRELPAPSPPAPPIAAASPAPAAPRPPPRRAAVQQPPRARSWPRRRRQLSARASRRIAGGLAAAIALALLVDRAPAIAAWSAATAETARMQATDAARSIAARTSEISAAGVAWARTLRPSRAVSPPAPPPIRVAVNSDPWSHVEVDGVAAGATPLMIELAPGPHTFRAAMADGRTVEREFDVAADRNRVVLR